MYLLVEFLTGFLFAFTFYKLGLQKELIVGLSIVSLLVIILVTDLVYMLIPNRILLFFLPIFILERIYIPLDSLWSSIIGSFGAFFILFTVGIISNGGIGGGDIKLFGVLGLALGWKLILITFIIACFTGTLWGGIAMKASKSKNSNPFPFGPCIAIGCLASYFYSEELIHWYFLILG
jgi:leader peptidase (prepilin peptidase) / N-methyltransferase